MSFLLTPKLNIMKTIYVLLAVLCCSLISCDNQMKPLKVDILPSKMIDNRYILQLETQDQNTLNFFTDTGGGFDIIWKSAFDKLELPAVETEIRGRKLQAVEWEALELKKTFKTFKMFNGELIVFPAPEMIPESDGFLGGSFFLKGAIWQFDYINKNIGTLDTVNWSKRRTNQIPMKIQKNANGDITGIHPALDVIIENDTLKMLFDTGATLLPTEKGREYLKPEGLETYSGSYLSTKKIEELHAQHPDWTFVEKASAFGGGANMIRVPKVKIGKYHAEMVWFVERPKSNFIRIDGENLDGAIGGNLMKDFKVIADYKANVFEFEK